MKQIRQIAPLLTALSLSLAPAVVHADDHHHKKDHENAREALRRGEILPLTRILALAQQRVPGDVIKVELDDDHARLIYEIKLLTPNGRVREVELDARTGAVLKVEDD